MENFEFDYQKEFRDIFEDIKNSMPKNFNTDNLDIEQFTNSWLSVFPQDGMYLFGCACLMLAAGADDEEENDKKYFHKAIKLVPEEWLGVFGKLYSGMIIYQAWLKRLETSKETKYEEYYVNLFKKHINKIIPGSKIVKGPFNLHHIPDAWIEKEGQLIPVECKKDNFTLKALNQLLRYMDNFKAKEGIAVGKKINEDIVLPKNIKFISLEELEKFEEKQV